MTKLLPLILLAAATTALVVTTAADIPPDQRAFFETRIRPVLVERCHTCHSATADKVQADLLLDSREAILRGGTHGPAVVPGDLMASLLISAIRWHDDKGMPPENKGGRLTDETIADFEQWVLMGAPYPPEAPSKKRGS